MPPNLCCVWRELVAWSKVGRLGLRCSGSITIHLLVSHSAAASARQSLHHHYLPSLLPQPERIVFHPRTHAQDCYGAVVISSLKLVGNDEDVIGSIWTNQQDNWRKISIIFVSASADPTARTACSKSLLRTM